MAVFKCKMCGGDLRIQDTDKVVQTTANAAVEPLLKRVYIFLEDENWERADEYCERVLDIDPECAEAYLGKLLAELRAKARAALASPSVSFENNPLYTKVLRYADDALKAELQGYLEENKNKLFEGFYQQATNKMLGAKSENNFLEAMRLFAEIEQYKDAQVLAVECRQKAEAAKRDHILEAAEALFASDRVADIQLAQSKFAEIPGYKDADEKAALCAKKIVHIQKKKKKRKRILILIAIVSVSLTLAIGVSLFAYRLKQQREYPPSFKVQTPSLEGFSHLFEISTSSAPRDGWHIGGWIIR